MNKDRLDTEIKINIIDRDTTFESEIMFSSKCDYVIRSSRADYLAKIMTGRVENESSFIFNCEHNRIELATPHFPTAPEYKIGNYIIEPACNPVIKRFRGNNFGRQEECLIVIENALFPMLRLTAPLMGKLLNPGFDKHDFKIATTIAPKLEITHAWDDNGLKNKHLTWHPAAIEHEKFWIELERGHRQIIPICDTDNIVRHLMTVYVTNDNKCAIVPLSYAQHNNFSKPLSCYFAFEKKWWLYNSEQLKRFPQAEIIITSEVGVALGNISSNQRIYMGYFFGHEMVEHLQLECLIGRNVKILIFRTDDQKSFAKKMKEAVLLWSALKKLDIEVTCYIAEEIIQISIESNFLHNNPNFPLKNCTFDKPYLCSKEKFISLAQQFRIDIPENLRTDRFGALTYDTDVPLVHNLISAGGLTSIQVHSRCNLHLLTFSIASGMLKKGSIFPGRWETKTSLKPLIFIPPTAIDHYKRLARETNNSDLKLYVLPEGGEADIKTRLADIRHETDCNLIIFSACNIVSKHKKLLEVASIWAQQNRIGIMVFSAEDTPSSAAFFADYSGRDFRVWHKNECDITYIVEERASLNKSWNFFTITLKDGEWQTKETTEDDVKELEDRKVSYTNYAKDDSDTKSDCIKSEIINSL